MIDRDGETFSEILNFLRRGSFSLSRPKKELENILADAEFYQIEPLISMLKEKLSGLQKIESGPETIPKIYVSCDNNALLKFKNVPKPVFHLILGYNGNCHFPMADEVQLFRKLYQMYGDEFIFSLELSSGKHTHWIVCHKGEQIECKTRVIF